MVGQQMVENSRCSHPDQPRSHHDLQLGGMQGAIRTSEPREGGEHTIHRVDPPIMGDTRPVSHTLRGWGSWSKSLMGLVDILRTWRQSLQIPGHRHLLPLPPKGELESGDTDASNEEPNHSKAGETQQGTQPH